MPISNKSSVPAAWAEDRKPQVLQGSKERVNSVYRRVCRIVKLGVFITMLAQFFYALRCSWTQIGKAPENNRFRGANLGACGNEPAFLPIITKGAFERAAGVWQRLRAAINYAKRAGNNAIATAVADIVLDKHRADLSPHN